MRTNTGYSVDEFNRLIIRRKNKKLVADGRFSLDKNNRLSYWLNEPESWIKENSLSRKVSFKGFWQLDSNHDLVLNLSKSAQTKAGYLVLKGNIISAQNNILAFEIASLDKRGNSHIQILQLGGYWQQDAFNRLCFVLSKKLSPDILVFEGAWELDKNQQIVYSYQKTQLKRKTKVVHTLSFSGYWQITQKNRLVYILSRNSNSQFTFCVQLDSPNIYPQDGLIKYRLGIGIKGSKLYKDRSIILYGSWKFSRALGLIFEIDYGPGKNRAIDFGIEATLTKKDKVVCMLKNKKGERLGISITLTHKLLRSNDAQAFIRLKCLEEESGIEAGVEVPF
ncbi:MAG: hypothetical protein HY761_08355 [Candidatus Omnitrophica bacterium]|nr:hypothetical protein [Candidatus Omnitrophota bacterium]